MVFVLHVRNVTWAIQYSIQLNFDQRPNSQDDKIAVHVTMFQSLFQVVIQSLNEFNTF